MEMYHNWKGFFRIAIMAICDVNYWVHYIDVGHYESNNDSGALLDSDFG